MGPGAVRALPGRAGQAVLGPGRARAAVSRRSRRRSRLRRGRAHPGAAPAPGRVGNGRHRQLPCHARAGEPVRRRRCALRRGRHRRVGTRTVRRRVLECGVALAPRPPPAPRPADRRPSRRGAARGAGPGQRRPPFAQVGMAIAGEPPFAEVFAADPPPDPARRVLAPEAYAEILDELGFGEQHVRLQVYVHQLPASADVLEWVKGTHLTYFRARLDDDLYELYLERYRRRLLDEIGETQPYLYTFKRILMWGRRV